MSHVVTVNIVIKDLDALEKACKKLGLKLNHGQKTHKWYGRWVNDYNATNAAYKNGIKPEQFGHCEHAISIPNNKAAYEIGLVENPDKETGGYVLLYDFWNGGNGMSAKVGGDNMAKLLTEYTIEAETAIAQSLGYSVDQSVLADGSIQLTCTEY